MQEEILHSGRFFCVHWIDDYNFITVILHSSGISCINSKLSILQTRAKHALFLYYCCIYIKKKICAHYFQPDARIWNIFMLNALIMKEQMLLPLLNGEVTASSVVVAYRHVWLLKKNSSLKAITSEDYYH